MGLSAGRDVQFDFDGSLDLARRLWSLADELETAASTRLSDAEGAIKSWVGDYAAQFIQRINDEQVSLTAVVSGLRVEAEQWATAWQLAMDQQNRVLHARHTQEVKDSRSGWGSFWGGMFGHDDLPAPPDPVRTPSAPGFYPTAGFYRGRS